MSNSLLSEQIRRACLLKGWDKGKLAKAAGVSRTTLYHLERGTTRRPRPTTLRRIAEALGVAVEELFIPPHAIPSAHPAAGIGPSCNTFNRRTNCAVDDVYEECPDMFSNWSPEEWDELYSTFGTGGPLTPSGVTSAARQINDNRETVQQLRILLDTHLRVLAVNMIGTLFQMVSPGDDLSAFPGVAPPAERPQSPESRYADGRENGP